MKKRNFISIAFTFLLLTLFATTPTLKANEVDETTAASGSVQPRLVTLPLPDHVFIPRGFDNNDRAQVVLWGYLPNICYRMAPFRHKIDTAQKKITIIPSAYLYKEEYCGEMAIEYTETVELGILPEGHYNVFIKTDEGEFAMSEGLPVKASQSSNADDDYYAIVENVEIKPDEASHERTLVLTGYIPSPCFALKEIKVLKTAQNVIEVLPIMIKTNEDVCIPMAKRFTETVPLKGPYSERTLIHIRSLNGKSLNQVAKL